MLGGFLDGINMGYSLLVKVFINKMIGYRQIVFKSSVHRSNKVQTIHVCIYIYIYIYIYIDI